MIYDSPGLQDGTGNDDKYIEDMSQYYDSVDLVFYCIDFTIDRWVAQDNKAVEMLSKKFGNGFWEKTIVVLTKANAVQVLMVSEPGYETRIEKRFTTFVQKTRQCLNCYNIAPKTIQAIPFVAAGYKYMRMLVYVSERLKIQPNGADYLAELWTTCLTRLQKSKSYLPFVTATFTSGRYVLDPTEAANFDNLIKMIQSQIDEEELRQMEAKEEHKRKMIEEKKCKAVKRRS